ncbi:MAG: xanthine dehydrogenase family protein [Alphaproteobacteria bacterium]|nr:xanthine dehydrogenase family protein [Alphaproteobacteria bacterium]
MSDKGIGARILRKEDHRHLHGRANFTADIAMPNMLNLAFVRSGIAHGRLVRVTKPADAADRVFAFDDLVGVKTLRAVSKLPTYKLADYPCLATGKVKFVGEPIAACLADSRAEAEDLAARVAVEIDPLPPVMDMVASRAPGTAIVHEDWSDNIALTIQIPSDIDEVVRTAPVKVSGEYKMSRHAMVPMEGRAVLAYWDDRQDQLVVYSATQVPHLNRAGISDILDIEQRQVRVIAPDVGGGFGLKALVFPEEIVACWLALRTRRPVRWIEDRVEHLIADANCREHHYRISAYADRTGKILALEGEVTVDAGAYSVYPFTNGLEAAMAIGNLPGPYHVPAYRGKAYTVTTNKPPLAPYRGVARPGVAFAIEQTIDAIARAVGRDPFDVRLENLVPAAAMPYTSVAKKTFDSGDYPEALRRVARMLDLPGLRERQKRREPDGRLIGVGFGCYTEQTAHGTSVFASWGIQLVPGFEQATVRLTPDGGLEVRVGVQSHGQGMETTIAQVASTTLGIDPARVNVVHGDTGLTPFSTGTYASRSIVMAGGATSRACKVLATRLVRIGAHLMQCEAKDVQVKDGKVVGPRASVEFSEIGRVWYMRPDELPPDVDMGGLECTVGYRPDPDYGTFAYASHGAVVAVDPDTGVVEVLDYVICEDCGTMVNPMVVEGQAFGGAVQGIGTALYEESPYDDQGQPLHSTFADYTLPGATEAPMIRIDHMISPSPHTEYGIKGTGEGGNIPTSGLLANAVNDALRSLGAEVHETPITPRRVLEAIARARKAAA